MQNAAVLPVPVCAEARISFPSRTKGIDLSWIGVGVVKLRFLRDLVILSFKLNFIKSEIYIF